MNDVMQQAQARHETIARLASTLYEQGDPGGPLDHWLKAERLAESCPHCGEQTMAGLPWFGRNATTVCPACGRVVLYRDRLPTAPLPEEEQAAKANRWVGVMLRVFPQKEGP